MENPTDFVNQVVCGDAIELIPRLEDQSIHLFLSDIPYGIGFDEWDVLHKNSNSALLGTSPAQGNNKMFSRRGKPID